MLARDMQISFIRQISAINPQLEVPEMPDSDTIFYWINYAQQKYLKEMYISKQSAKENVEFIQRRIEDLKQLITRAPMFGANNYIISTVTPGSPITITSTQSTRIVGDNDGALLFPLPSNYFYYLRSTSLVNGTYLQVPTLSWIENTLIEHSEVTPNIISNAINTPIIRNPLVLLEGSPVSGDPSLSYIVMYSDIYTSIYNVEITYIRNPRQIVLNVTNSSTQVNQCELAFQVHQDIVDYSVKLYIEDFKYKLQQTKK